MPEPKNEIRQAAGDAAEFVGEAAADTAIEEVVYSAVEAAGDVAVEIIGGILDGI